MKQLYYCFVFIVARCLFTNIKAQTPRIDFEAYEPVSTLVVPQHLLKKAKYPFIDIHNHQPRMATQNLSQLTAQMDSLNMKVMVNLSGIGGAQLRAMMYQAQPFPNRFIFFTNLDFRRFGADDWAEKAVKQLREDVAAGARGLKIFKELGLTEKDIKGARIAVDDPRLDAVWQACGEMGIPVLIHSAAPKSFWDPLDNRNERLLEMTWYKDRVYTADKFAPWEQIIAEQHRMFKKHSKTTFINAHFGWMGNDLQALTQLMNDIPNMYIEFGAVIAELGRQPRAARSFFETFQDRILFGKDSWVPDEYTTYFRVLETADEYFPYHKKYHAFWAMYGMNLPDSILKKIYYKNALKLIKGIDKTQFPD